MTLQHIVETSKNLKEVLERQGYKPTFYRREQLKETINDNNWSLNSKVDPDRPLGNRGVWKYTTLTDLRQIISESQCWTQVLRALSLCEQGSTSISVQRYASKHKINTDHFIGKSYNETIITKIPNEHLFQRNSTSRTSTIRKRILQEDLITYVCSECGQQPFHNGKELTLQLDHINGDRTDHRLENLTFLCPNCHTQTSTWGRKIRRN